MLLSIENSTQLQLFNEIYSHNELPCLAQLVKNLPAMQETSVLKTATFFELSTSEWP